MNLRQIAARILLFFFLCSCSLAPMRPAPLRIDPDAERRLAALAAVNEGLKTFKGLGTLRLMRSGNPQSARAAWIAQTPDRLRLELLGPAGAPLASVAAAGDRIDIYLHKQGNGVLRRSAGRGLERLTGIPMEAAEAVSMLAGRVFLIDFRSARLDGEALVLEDGAGRALQKIHPARPGFSGLVMERFDKEGELQYRVHLEAPRALDGFTVPGTVRVTTGGGEALRLTMDRFWGNPDVDPDVFSLGAKTRGGREGR